MRELLQERHGPFFIATPAATRLDEVATIVHRAVPDDVARLGFAVAHELDSAAPAVEGLAEELHAVARQIADSLREAQRPLVISGPTCGSEPVLQAAANVARALFHAGRKAGLSFVMPECNSFGLGLMGAGKLSAAFDAMRKGAADTRHYSGKRFVPQGPGANCGFISGGRRPRGGAGLLANRTSAKAELVLPAASFAEGDGTVVNNEGRAQRSFSVFAPAEDVQESWRWLRDVMVAAGRREANGWGTLDDLWGVIAAAMPALARAREAAPPSSFRLAGAKIPREPHRYSGRTAMLANINVSEPRPPEDPDAPLTYTMEGYPAQPPAPLTPFFWAGGWNSDSGDLEISRRGERAVTGRRCRGAATRGASRATVPMRAVSRRRSSLEPASCWSVPFHHIFGSEELSRSAPAIMELAPQAYVALNPEDLSQLGMNAGEEVTVEVGGTRFQLPVKVRPDLPKGVAGLPFGVAPTEGVSLPAWATVSIKI